MILFIYFLNKLKRKVSFVNDAGSRDDNNDAVAEKKNGFDAIDLVPRKKKTRNGWGGV